MDINQRIASRLSSLRRGQQLSLDALAQKCNVSRSMISLIERGESSATAVVLEKLATGLGVPLSVLFDDNARPISPLVRRSEQAQWTDPQSGYVRRNLCASGAMLPLQLVEVTFPARASVAYEISRPGSQIFQQIWLLAGRINIRVGEEDYAMEPGDCLGFRLDRPTVFHNPADIPAHYLVAIATGENLE